MDHLHSSQFKKAPLDPTRRKVLMFGAGGALAAAVAAAAGPASASSGQGDVRRRLDTALSGLEAAHGVTIGVAAGRRGQPPAYAYRGGDTFPMCSLFKTLAVARLLRDHAYDDDFWQRRIPFRKDQIVVDSVICAADKDRNMSVDGAPSDPA